MSNHEDQKLKEAIFQEKTAQRRTADRNKMLCADRWSIMLTTHTGGVVREYPNDFPDSPPDALRVHVVRESGDKGAQALLLLKKIANPENAVAFFSAIESNGLDLGEWMIEVNNLLKADHE